MSLLGCVVFFSSLFFGVGLFLFFISSVMLIWKWLWLWPFKSVKSVEFFWLLHLVPYYYLLLGVVVVYKMTTLLFFFLLVSLSVLKNCYVYLFQGFILFLLKRIVVSLKYLLKVDFFDSFIFWSYSPITLYPLPLSLSPSGPSQQVLFHDWPTRPLSFTRVACTNEDVVLFTEARAVSVCKHLLCPLNVFSTHFTWCSLSVG